MNDRRSAQLRWRGALTFIELMAVIVLLGVVAATVAVRLSLVHEDVELRSAAEAIRELERRARLHSQSGNRVLMVVDETARGRIGHSSSVVLIDLVDRAVVSRVELPRDAVVRLSDGGDKDAVVFDRTGRSGDYSVRLIRGPHSIAWSVRGLTGEMLRMEGPVE